MTHKNYVVNDLMQESDIALKNMSDYCSDNILRNNVDEIISDSRGNIITKLALFWFILYVQKINVDKLNSVSIIN